MGTNRAARRRFVALLGLSAGRTHGRCKPYRVVLDVAMGASRRGRGLPLRPGESLAVESSALGRCAWRPWLYPRPFGASPFA